jgi:hypothetical protein
MSEALYSLLPQLPAMLLLAVVGRADWEASRLDFPQLQAPTHLFPASPLSVAAALEIQAPMA